MTPEIEALRRCERLLALMAEAMEMERAFAERTAGIDASARSLLKPILDSALARLEPLMSRDAGRPLTECVRELVDLELELDSALAKRGWRVIDSERDLPPPSLTDPL